MISDNLYRRIENAGVGLYGPYGGFLYDGILNLSFDLDSDTVYTFDIGCRDDEDFRRNFKFWLKHHTDDGCIWFAENCFLNDLSCLSEDVKELISEKIRKLKDAVIGNPVSAG